MTAVTINVCCSHALLHASATHTALHEGTFHAQTPVRCCHLPESSLRSISCMCRTPQRARIVMPLPPRAANRRQPAACIRIVLLRCS